MEDDSEFTENERCEISAFLVGTNIDIKLEGKHLDNNKEHNNKKIVFIMAKQNYKGYQYSSAKEVEIHIQ